MQAPTTLRLASLAGAAPVLLAVAVAAIVFQAVHFLEHVLQAGYLVLHPLQPAWLTPWAEWARDGIGVLLVHHHGAHTHAGQTPGGHAVANEVLHLVGNGIFFAGVVVLWCYARLCSGARSRLPLVGALALQGLHLAEHLLLTGSVAATGSAVGVSTLFGALDSGSLATWYRVWLHFALNFGATAFAVWALVTIARRPAPTAASGARKPELAR